MNENKPVTDWIDAAQQEPSTRNVALYFGLCLEELIEGWTQSELETHFTETRCT